MKKNVLASLFALLPPLGIILTTPFSSISEHSGHIVLFALVGLGMAGYSLKNNRTSLPSFTTLLFALLLLFTATRAMPCPYMFSPHTAQLMIDHPCSQPMTPSMPILSFDQIPVAMNNRAMHAPILPVFAFATTTDNKSPPFV